MSEDDNEAWLAKVYGATDERGLVRHYDAWADTYDDDLTRFGYRHPALVVAMLARYVGVGDGPVLDAGVGTGLLGELLAVLGYRDLTGIDMSDGMLRLARAKGVYRALANMVLGQPLAFADDRFAATISTGVLTVGHAPPAALDELIRVTRADGYMIFTITTKAYQEAGFEQKIDELEAQGRWRRQEITRPYVTLPATRSEASQTAQIFVYRVN